MLKLVEKIKETVMRKIDPYYEFGDDYDENYDFNDEEEDDF